MKRTRRTRLSAGAFLLLTLAPAGGRAGVDAGSTSEAAWQGCFDETWLRRLWPDPQRVQFAPTTLKERLAFAVLVPALLKAAPGATEPPRSLRALASSVGFVLEEVNHADQTFWVVRERQDRLRGAGAYVVRAGPARDAVLQAPHVYFDLDTDVLGLSLFLCAPEGARPRAFATNTAHRYQGHPDERGAPEHPADVAHNPDHLFQVVTDLMAKALPNLQVVQLHGFGAGTRKERAGLTAVVSSGSRTVPPALRSLLPRLGGLLGEGVRLYPDQVGVLGGTTNAQARLLQAYPRARFIHLELSPDARRALRSPRQVGKLGRVLFASEEE